MSEPSTQAIVYCRVSSKKQEEDATGLQSQETRCREHAAALGLDVVAVFPDTFTGGGDYMRRPGMVALLSFLDAQPDTCFTVIFDDLKRASRDTRAFLDLRDAFRFRNVRLECLNFKLGETPEDEFIETIIAAHGALEHKQNGRQVAQKMKARIQSGYWIHAAPIGYRYEKVKGRGRILFPDDHFANVIRDAFEGYASGRFATQAEVKRFFEGFPDLPYLKRGELKQQRVTDILTQPLYAGYICSENYGISWLKGQHEPLISVETFEKVQDRRKSVAKAPKRANIGEDFALRGFVCCADCSAPLRSSLSKGRSKYYAYYLCQTKDCVSYGKSIARDKIEGHVGALIKELQPTDGLFRLAAGMVKAAWDHRRGQAKDILRVGKRQIADIEKQVDGLLTRVLDSTNDTVIRKYEEKIGDLERQKRILADKLTNQAEPRGSFEEKLEPVLTFLANPWKLWESGHISMRRTVLKLAFAERVHYSRTTGARTPEIALPLRALGGISNTEVRCGADGGT